MYYKIENKECEVYKKLHAMRTEELQMAKDNKETLKEKIGLSWNKFLGDHGQQNFFRLPQYSGFVFMDEIENIDTKVWKKHADMPHVFIPNKRTQAGRDMSEFLTNGLKKSWYNKPMEIIGLADLKQFVFPFVEIVDDVILLFIDDQYCPEDENLVEITRTEFEKYLSTPKEKTH